MKKGKILVVGPVVLDTIQKKEFHGGTAGNMSYGLGILRTKPMLFSLAGSDFLDTYEKHLKKSGVDLRVHIDKKNKTARYYDVLEFSKNQIRWFPNAYKNIDKISLNKTISKKDLKEVTFSIFSSTKPKSVIKHIENLKNHSLNAVIIFDPGPSIFKFSKKELEKCVGLGDIFIVNENEYAQAEKILKQDPLKVFNKKIIIKTLGEKGSVIFENGKTIKIKAIRPKKIVDTTGAGDAYRAGLIFGLWKGLSLVKACALGAKMAAKNIACLGCQRYEIPKC